LKEASKTVSENKSKTQFDIGSKKDSITGFTFGATTSGLSTDSVNKTTSGFSFNTSTTSSSNEGKSVLTNSEIKIESGKNKADEISSKQSGVIFGSVKSKRKSAEDVSGPAIPNGKSVAAKESFSFGASTSKSNESKGFVFGLSKSGTLIL